MCVLCKVVAISQQTKHKRNARVASHQPLYSHSQSKGT